MTGCAYRQNLILAWSYSIHSCGYRSTRGSLSYSRITKTSGSGRSANVRSIEMSLAQGQIVRHHPKIVCVALPPLGPGHLVAGDIIVFNEKADAVSVRL